MSLHRTPERSFNRIEIYGNTVTKTIFDIERGQRELFFYLNLPEQQKRFFPRIINWVDSKKIVSYKMEYIPTRDVSFLYLNDLLTENKIIQLFKGIDSYFLHLDSQTVTSTKWMQVASEVILEKMNRRWETYKKSYAYKTTAHHFFKQKKISIDLFKINLEKRLTQSLLENKGNLLFATHGDLCFSNIFLFSQTKIQFVDPRGALKRDDLYIPLIYDLAKISQCLNGNYDGILAQKKELNFGVQKRLFKSWLLSKKISLPLIRLVESSLFLSLLPLHLDRPETHVQMVESAFRAYREGQ